MSSTDVTYNSYPKRCQGIVLAETVKLTAFAVM